MSDAIPVTSAPAPHRPRTDRLVGVWLLVICALVAVMILVGGATRLTDSGLSITEWRPVSGALAPVSDAQWALEFEKYRATYEYQAQNRGMSLAEFKTIYWWEWGHRLLGRVIGVAFAIPFLAFWAMGRLKGRFWACLGLFALGGAQGAIGWWMVRSGLDEPRLDVDPVRLATHLGLAFLILALGWRLALDALGWPRERAGGGLGRLGWVFSAVLFLQILAGALMAGADAGRAYADWPGIGGEAFPSGYARLSPFLANFVENHAAIQFNHRTLGYVLAGLALWLGWRTRALRGAARLAGLAVAGLSLGQVVLGIATILAGSTLHLSLAHQGGAVLLWLAAHTFSQTQAAR